MQENQEKDFGDFEEVKEESKSAELDKKETIEISTRVRMPKGKEIIGIIVLRLGGNRMDVKTTDGKTRNCRVPGRYRRRLWLRPKDIILIVPWEYDDKKGDVIYKYNFSAVNQLKKKGILDILKEEF
ncbi:MAG: translation initiation factor eIF-1A [Nanoarchaeota archaeon]|nr:translation initiation factor eIF-1A [Nanoarchaeota archaeon]